MIRKRKLLGSCPKSGMASLYQHRMPGNEQSVPCAEGSEQGLPNHIRVLAVAVTAQIGGAERSLLDLLSGIDRSEFEVQCALPGRGLLTDELNDSGIITHHLPFRIGLSSDGNGMWSLVSCGLRLTRLLMYTQPNLLYANNGTAALYAAVPASITKIPLISHIRDLHRFTRAGRWLLAKASMIITNSLASQRIIHDMGITCTQTIYNGVDLKRFTVPIGSNSLKRELGWPDSVLIIGMVGVIAPNKRIEEFIACAARLRSDSPSARFVIVGDIICPTDLSYRQKMFDLVRELGLEQYVFFLGFRSNMVEIMQSIDILVHVGEDEGFGRVVIEAMACGKPVVAKAAGGLLEIVVEGVTGFLLPPEHPEMLANRIAELIRNAETRQRFGVSGRQRAVELFDSRLYVRRIQDAFRQVVGDYMPEMVDRSCEL